MAEIVNGWTISERDNGFQAVKNGLRGIFSHDYPTVLAWAKKNRYEDVAKRMGYQK
jgi:hypothetical protein